MSAEIDALIDIVVTGKIKEAKTATQKCLDSGIGAKAIVFDGLSKAMEIVGEKYAAKQYFLPQVLLSANTLYQGLNLVLPLLAGDGGKTKGTVVIAVVEGDVVNGSVMAGQIAGMVKEELTCQDLIQKLVSETDSLIGGKGFYE